MLYHFWKATIVEALLWVYEHAYFVARAGSCVALLLLAKTNYQQSDCDRAVKPMYSRSALYLFVFGSSEPVLMGLARRYFGNTDCGGICVKKNKKQKKKRACACANFIIYTLQCCQN